MGKRNNQSSCEVEQDAVVSDMLHFVVTSFISYPGIAFASTQKAPLWFYLRAC